MRKYILNNGFTGVREEFATIEAAMDRLSSVAVDRLIELMGYCPIIVSDTDEAGVESWRNMDGVQIPTEESLAKLRAEMSNHYDWV